jgi:hypothetical protein
MTFSRGASTRDGASAPSGTTALHRGQAASGVASRRRPTQVQDTTGLIGSEQRRGNEGGRRCGRGGGLSVETCMGNREVLCGQQSEHIAAQMATHRGEVTVGFGQTLLER